MPKQIEGYTVKASLLPHFLGAHSNFHFWLGGMSC